MLTWGLIMAVVRSGIYLEDNPPVRKQFRVGRRSQVKPVIVLHTAEGGTDFSGADSKAENVASYLRTADRAGSYHLLGDADSIIQLVKFENEAYQDGTGSNPWAVGISLSMNSADWPRLSSQRKEEFVDSAAQMAVMAATWMQSIGLQAPAAVRLSKALSDSRGASGFISHGDRDPARRSDPGIDFPWSDFFETYNQMLNFGEGAESNESLTTEALTKELQRLVGATSDGIVGPKTMAALNKNWLGRDETFDSSVADTFVNNPVLIKWVQRQINVNENFGLTVDGQYGAITEQAVIEHLDRSGVIAAESYLALLEKF